MDNFPDSSISSRRKHSFLRLGTSCSFNEIECKRDPVNNNLGKTEKTKLKKDYKITGSILKNKDINDIFKSKNNSFMNTQNSCFNDSDDDLGYNNSKIEKKYIFKTNKKR